MSVENPQRRQVAMVTGASSGIGRMTARTLAAQGWDLVLASRSATGLDPARIECEAAGASVLVVPTDVGDRPAVQALFRAAVERYSRVDAVINSAAVVGYGRFDEVPAEVFDRAVITNLLGTANVAREALAHFTQHGGGKLVLVGSLLGKIAVPFMSPYVTGKWGVHGLARMIQIEARQTPGIEVSLVSPGSVNTPAYLQAANYSGWEGRPPPPIDPPEKVARAIVRTLAEPARDRSVGLANHLVVLSFRALPAVFDAVVTPLMKLGGLSRRPIAVHSGTVFEPRPAVDDVHGPWNRIGRRSPDPSPNPPPNPPPGTAGGSAGPGAP